jgi:hypothetical protein
MPKGKHVGPPRICLFKTEIWFDVPDADGVWDFGRRHGSRVRLQGCATATPVTRWQRMRVRRIVQERLGYSCIAITMDIYSHLMPNMQAAAAAKVDAMLKAVQKNGARTEMVAIG